MKFRNDYPTEKSSEDDKEDTKTVKKPIAYIYFGSGSAFPFCGIFFYNQRYGATEHLVFVPSAQRHSLGACDEGSIQLAFSGHSKRRPAV